MNKNRIKIPSSEVMKLPKIFRQNIFQICIFSLFFQTLYYPVFLYKRRKTMQDICKMPRYKFHYILPFIGLGVQIVIKLVISTIVSREISSEQLITANSQIDFSELIRIVTLKYDRFVMIDHLGYIFALLCFAVAMIDLLVVVSELLKNLRVQFPKMIHYTPYVFTIVSFGYIIISTLSMQNRVYAPTFNLVLETLFIVSLILAHMYLMNTYMLLRTVQIKKEI